MNLPNTGSEKRIGIIAGGGALPRLLVSACLAQGRDVFVLALKDYTDDETVKDTDHAWVRLGALGEAFQILKDAGVCNVVFAGAVRRPSLAHLRPDLRGAALFAKIGHKALGDDGLLRAVADEFAKEGLHLCGAHEVVHDLLAKEGCYGRLTPSKIDDTDIARAFEVAKGLGALDVGQGAVVQQGIVLAVEAVEGTDSMLSRCKGLRREGSGGVLVKVCKPGQDKRLDLPTIGVQTVEAVAAAGLSGVAIEAGAALVLDSEAIAKKADDLGVFVKGLPAISDSPLIYIIAGEPSGDILGARLMQSLKEKTNGHVRFAGVGGESMDKEGVTSLFPQADIAVMGFAEVVPKIPKVLQRVKDVTADILKRKPTVIITVDSLGFNKRIAKALIAKRSKIPRVHYVAPMVWAWKPKRAETLAHLFDHLMCLLAFEPPYFEKYGLPTSHVGHPVIESGVAGGDAVDFRKRHEIDPDEQVVCVLPGSRQNEVSRMLPIFCEATELLRKTHPNLRVVIPTVATVANYVEEVTKQWPHPPVVVRGEPERWNAFAASQGAMATSGTVSLELARAHIPFVIGYTANKLSAWFARSLISIRYATLINHVCDDMIVPEFIQEDCTPENLVKALAPLLDAPVDRDAYLARVQAGLAKVVGPFERPSHIAADVVLKVAGIAIAESDESSHLVSDNH